MIDDLDILIPRDPYAGLSLIFGRTDEYNRIFLGPSGSPLDGCPTVLGTLQPNSRIAALLDQGKTLLILGSVALAPEPTAPLGG